jgi:hypothetical protein
VVIQQEVPVALCPFCRGTIPDNVLKCQHCAEWIDGRPSGERSELGIAARRFVNAWIAMMVIAMLFVAWLAWYFIVPAFTSVRRDFGL